MQHFDYIFNVGGNYKATITGMTEATGDFSAKVESANKGIGKITSMLAGLDLFRNATEQVNVATETLSASGITLDSQMHDLSAIAGIVGDDLKAIEDYARKSAKAFGTDAAVAVEGYKLLLSQLSPEIAKCPEALSAMGNSVQITSKLMGGDGVAAAEVLTTAMNQYGVSLDDPIEASRKMAQMMNVMAAAGQAGSAELPAIKVALEQCGMAAKAANISFEETNAAIQVLDKAGKKGSEGGVALRNTLAILGQGRFLPKQTQEELMAVGVDVMSLADTSLTLKERLELLKPVMNDAALFSKLFGMENANAARALVQGADELGSLTEAVRGTQSAEQQAQIVMESYAERQARINQKIEDFKITIFQATGDLTLWASSIMSVITPLTQLAPVLVMLANGFKFAFGKLSAFAAMMRRMPALLRLMDMQMRAGTYTSLGFSKNIMRASAAVLRFGTVGIMQGIKALGAYVLSLVTGGATSASFASIASASFTSFKMAAVTACRSVGVAIKSIPIIGWIAAAIAALVALVAYFWNTSATFRAVLKGLWAGFKQFFVGLSDLAKGTFTAIGDLIRAAFSLDADGIMTAVKKLKGTYSDYGAKIGNAFTNAYNAEMEASKKDKKEAPESTDDIGETIPGVPNMSEVDVTSGSLSSVGGGKSGDKIKSVTVNVDKLVERFEIHTTNMQGDITKVKEMVSEALLSALNDVNLAV